MEDDVQPRSKLSVWLFGLLLGPVILMLWLGRGWLAVIYFLAQLAVFGGIIWPVAAGMLMAPAWADLPIVMALLSPLLNIIGLIHGLRIRAASVKRPWYSRWYAVIILPLAVAWLIFLVLLRSGFYQSFTIPSASMVPSLRPGDYVFVSKMAYGYSRFSFPGGIVDFPGRIWAGEPQRGDIVIFKLPRDNKTDYVKRLIGLPGDRIQLREGVVYLNGEALPLTPVQGIPCLEGEQCNFFRETLPGGRSYVINDKDPNGPADNTAEYVVPAENYFMMGDNRDNSLDSRFAQNAPGGGVGYVPYENLLGRVDVIYWNSYGLRIDDRLAGYPGK